MNIKDNQYAEVNETLQAKLEIQTKEVELYEQKQEEENNNTFFEQDSDKRLTEINSRIEYYGSQIDTIVANSANNFQPQDLNKNSVESPLKNMHETEVNREAHLLIKDYRNSDVVVVIEDSKTEDIETVPSLFEERYKTLTWIATIVFVITSALLGTIWFFNDSDLTTRDLGGPGAYCGYKGSGNHCASGICARCHAYTDIHGKFGNIHQPELKLCKPIRYPKDYYYKCVDYWSAEKCYYGC